MTSDTAAGGGAVQSAGGTDAPLAEGGALPPPGGPDAPPTGGDAPPPASLRRRFAAFLLECALFAGTLGVGWLAWSVAEWRSGRTPAKRLTGLRVVDARTGEAAGLRRMALRQLVYGAGVFGLFGAVTLGLGWLAGAALVLAPGRASGWDRLALTTVVHPAGPPAAPPGRGARVVRAAALAVLVPWTLAALLGPGAAPVHMAAAVVTGQQADAVRDDPVRCARGPAAVSGSTDPKGALRVFALGYRLRIGDGASYAAYRSAMRCLVERYVEPYRVPGRPTLVVFPEDVGLPTLAVGPRGAGVRAQASTRARAVSETVPLGMGAALAQLNTAYAPQIAAYQAKFGPLDPRKALLLAETDTFARAFSRTFSDIARDYGVYVVAGNNQARYRETRNPLEVALFADPQTVRSGRAYVATDAHVANTTFLWGPRDVRANAPDGERNLLFRNEKVPLTPLETDVLGLDEGPRRGPAAVANAAGVTVEGFRLGFATSLPAFTYGYAFGERPPGFEPCADLRVSYAACMDEQGVDVMIQADANPGRWAADSGSWQPLEWMGSTWRAVADPTLHFRYNITPMMTGNLFDLVFDGQSAITARDAQAPPRRYVGNASFGPDDLPEDHRYAGDKREFLALSPWSAPDGPRPDLMRAASRLAPGSGDARENAYVESAVYADLVR
ncbi:RDD family protein [Streptomyces sp. NPDC051940]|uniref:RDD family protein n=1 Tax=Streptomyces sp. NPDC051940 TaxID=3155675 RepID=UPI00342BF38D